MTPWMRNIPVTAYSPHKGLTKAQFWCFLCFIICTSYWINSQVGSDWDAYDACDITLMNSSICMIYVTIFSCDQAALWMVQSVRPSVCPSVCLSVCLSHLFDYVPIIVSSWNFQELLPVTKVTSMQKVKVRGQRSRSQRSQPNLTVSGL